MIPVFIAKLKPGDRFTFTIGGPLWEVLLAGDVPLCKCLGSGKTEVFWGADRVYRVTYDSQGKG